MDEKKDMMSRAEAAFVCMTIVRGLPTRETTALQIAARNLLKRHFDNLKNKARRRESATTPETTGENQ